MFFFQILTTMLTAWLKLLQISAKLGLDNESCSYYTISDIQSELLKLRKAESIVLLWQAQNLRYLKNTGKKAKLRGARESYWNQSLNCVWTCSKERYTLAQLKKYIYSQNSCKKTHSTKRVVVQLRRLC